MPLSYHRYGTVLHQGCRNHKLHKIPEMRNKSTQSSHSRSSQLQTSRLRGYKKTPASAIPGFTIKSLAVTYFHMGKPHTIIGAEQFHFRVRDGIGWFPLAKAARQTVWKETGDDPDFQKINRDTVILLHGKSGSVPYFLFLNSVSCIRYGMSLSSTKTPTAWVLYGQASRAISTG
jgi:hypothetical protein